MSVAELKVTETVRAVAGFLAIQELRWQYGSDVRASEVVSAADQDWRGHVDEAKALLEEIRTPTADMIRAGEAWLDHCSDVDSLFSEMVKVAIHGPE